MAKKEQNTKFKKAPQAPRRFKSAYMFFSTEQHKKIRQDQHGTKLQTTDVAKMVSERWKSLPAEEREEWEEMARRDKRRYEVEKTMYTGPWKVPATKARSQKDPNAPKRPMSAFLSYSNSKRAAVKASNPDIGNAEVSRILAKMWKEAPEEERKIHIEKEFELRQQYKSAIAIWRQNADEELKAARKKREDIALQHVDTPENSYRRVTDSRPNGCSEADEPERKSPLRAGNAARPTGPTAPASYAPGGPFGMGFSNSDGDSSTSLPPFPTSNPGPFGPIGMGSNAPVSTDPGRAPEATTAQGMIQSGSYPEAYTAEFTVPINGYDAGYHANMAAGFYGAYYPSAPPQFPQASPNMAMWGGQYYGNRNGQYPAQDGSSGFTYGGY